MPINSLIDKQNLAYPCNGVLFGHKNNEVLTHATTGINIEILW